MPRSSAQRRRVGTFDAAAASNCFEVPAFRRRFSFANPFFRFAFWYPARLARFRTRVLAASSASAPRSNSEK
jgi:hypothetical protein